MKSMHSVKVHLQFANLSSHPPPPPPPHTHTHTLKASSIRGTKLACGRHKNSLSHYYFRRCVAAKNTELALYLIRPFILLFQTFEPNLACLGIKVKIADLGIRTILGYAYLVPSGYYFKRLLNLAIFPSH